MQEFSYVVQCEMGIHARLVAILANEAKKYKSKMIMIKGSKTAYISNAMEVLGLHVKCGQMIKVKIIGVDEKNAYQNMKNFLYNNL